MAHLITMRRFLPILLVAAIVCLDGYLYGVWTNRWGMPVDAKAVLARLQDVPMKIGEWEGEAKPMLDAREAERAGFDTYFVRRYTNRRTGATVSVLLACGRPGPLSVHTPDVCYRGAGYQGVGAAAPYTEKDAAGGVVGELWKAQFATTESNAAGRLQVFWSWNGAGEWKAPTNPRIVFAGSPALFKLYVVHEVVRDDPRTTETGSQFLPLLLPEVNKTLFDKKSATN